MEHVRPYLPQLSLLPLPSCHHKFVAVPQNAIAQRNWLAAAFDLV